MKQRRYLLDLPTLRNGGGGNGSSGVGRWLCIPWILLATICVQAPYFSARHYNDDYQYLRDAARFQVGQEGAWEYLFRPQNEHCMPVWRGWYYAQWRLFSLNPIPWHLVIAAVQAVSGCFLFLILDRYLLRPAAFLAGVSWGASTLGSWDNPMVLIAASHFTLATASMLAAAYCLSQANDEQAGRRLAAVWLVGMVISLTFALLTMGAMLLAAPALLAQRWLLARERRPSAVAMTLLWLVPVAAAVCLQLLSVTPAISKTAAMNAEWSATAIYGRFLGIYAIAFTQLFGESAAVGVTPHLVERVVLAAVVCVLAIVAGTAHGRRLLIWGGLLTIGFAAATVGTRLFLSTEQFLESGRYRLLPTLWWCVVSGVLLDGMVRRGPALMAKAFPFAVAGVSVAIVVHQYRNAVYTANYFQEVVAAPHHGFRQIQQSLAEVHVYGKVRDEAVILPDVEINMVTIPMQLSEVSVVTFGDRLSGLHFVPLNQFTDRELARTLMALRTAPQPMQSALGNMMREIAASNSRKKDDGEPAVP